MKWEYWIIVVVLLLLSFFGVIGQMKTEAVERQAVIDRQKDYIGELTAEIRARELAAEPEPFTYPLRQYWVSSRTGYRLDPLGGGDERLHKGIDLSSPEGTPVYAVLAGEVAEHWVTPDGGMWKGHPVLGGMIVLRHTDGLYSIYGHLSREYVNEGDWVEQGQIIGEVGDTGMSTAPHLHFELAVDPLEYLEGR